jgi:DNA adenine methylase
MFSFFGGKNSQSDWIYSYINPISNDIDTYAEIFSGSMWTYMNNDFSFAKNIIYNDLNIYLVNLFHCLSKPDFRQYLTKLSESGSFLYFDRNSTYEKQYQYYKELFLKCKKELYTDKLGQEIKIDIPDYKIAVKYFILLRHAFSSISNEKIGYSYSAESYKEGKPIPKPKSYAAIKKLSESKYTDKLDAITNFENLDFAELIKKYDSKKTMFYADPPYFSTENKYFRGDEHFGKEGHQRLADSLKNIKGKFILSYYDFEGLDKMYPKNKYTWKEKDFNKRTTSITKDGKLRNSTEILIMNF